MCDTTVTYAEPWPRPLAGKAGNHPSKSKGKGRRVTHSTGNWGPLSQFCVYFWCGDPSNSKQLGALSSFALRASPRGLVVDHSAHSLTWQSETWHALAIRDRSARIFLSATIFAGFPFEEPTHSHGTTWLCADMRTLAGMGPLSWMGGYGDGGLLARPDKLAGCMD